jgi:hypothetical protein
MRHTPFVLLTALVFATVGCTGGDDTGRDDATSATDTQTSGVAATVSDTLATTTLDDTTVPDPAVSDTTAPDTAEPDTAVSVTSDAQEQSRDVFSFADDDLCEWVTEEDVAGFVATAFEWDGTVTRSPPDAPSGGPTTCEWQLTADGDPTGILVATEAQWQSFGGSPYDLAALAVVDYDDADPADIERAAVSGHPALSEGVLVTADGWGQFAFWVPPGDEYLALMIDVPGEELSYPIDDRVFWVADQFLRELGWVN